MKAIITNPAGEPPCIVYWTGRKALHVEVVTYCDRDRKVNDGVLQVPEDVPCCAACEDAVKEHRYPKAR